MNLMLDWVMDSLLAQIRLLEHRAGRSPVAVRVCVPPPDGPRVSSRLLTELPGVEVDVMEKDGHPRVLTVSFAMNDA